jgi:hypothetical protein
MTESWTMGLVMAELFIDECSVQRNPADLKLSMIKTTETLTVMCV